MPLGPRGLTHNLSAGARACGAVRQWVDGSLRDCTWYRHVFETILARFPHYSIAIFHIVASDAVIFERAQKRGEATGRFVPETEIWDSIRRVPTTVEVLAPLCRFVATIDNSTDTPVLVRCQDPRINRDLRAGEGAELPFLELRKRFHFKGFGARALAKRATACGATRRRRAVSASKCSAYVLPVWMCASANLPAT